MSLLNSWQCNISKRDGRWTIELIDLLLDKCVARYAAHPLFTRSEAIAKAFDMWPYAELHIDDGEGDGLRPVSLFADFL